MNTQHCRQMLGPHDNGRYLITTQGSRHVWDLDAMTYQRLPGADRGSFDHDLATLPITRVARWPVVGQTFLVWFDDPDAPRALEHWRRSSRIVSIERLDEQAPS